MGRLKIFAKYISREKPALGRIKVASGKYIVDLQIIETKTKKMVIRRANGN